MARAHTIIATVPANDWDLSINRYKEIVYEEVEYDAPEVILDKIKKLDEERNQLIDLLNKEI